MKKDVLKTVLRRREKVRKKYEILLRYLKKKWFFGPRNDPSVRPPVNTSWLTHGTPEAGILGLNMWKDYQISKKKPNKSQVQNLKNILFLVLNPNFLIFFYFLFPFFSLRFSLFSFLFSIFSFLFSLFSFFFSFFLFSFFI